jgi:hypothetical protein
MHLVYKLAFFEIKQVRAACGKKSLISLRGAMTHPWSFRHIEFRSLPGSSTSPFAD